MFIKPPPPLKLGHNAAGRAAKSPFGSWNSFSFVLKVNKIGQQCKYFHSREASQTHRCVAEAERGGSMGLAGEEACAADPSSSMFQSFCQERERASERASYDPA